MNWRAKTAFFLVYLIVFTLGVNLLWETASKAEEQQVSYDTASQGTSGTADTLTDTSLPGETAAAIAEPEADGGATPAFIAEGGVKVYLPFNFSLIMYPEVTMVGAVDNLSQTKITMKINGKPYTLPLEKKVFHTALELIPGENEILFGKSKMVLFYYQKSEKIHRPEKLTPQPPANFKKYQFHSELAHPECLGCHKLGPDIAGLPDCYEKCHLRVLKYSWAHGPTGEFRCLACHDPFGDKTGYALILTGKELCFSCHATMIPKKHFVHTAVEKGMCLGCHDPHSTPYKKVLRYEGGKLCYTCHEEKTRPEQYFRGETLYKGEPAPEYTYPHPPIVEGQCLTCHEPHESDYRGNLRDKQIVLCTNYNCHKSLQLSPINGEMAGHIHPFDKDPATSSMVAVPKDVKLDEKGMVLCYTCHTPHGSNRDGFLIGDLGDRQRGEKLCGKCHPPVDTIDGGEIEQSIKRDEMLKDDKDEKY